MRTPVLALLPAALATLVACVGDVGEGRVAATVQEVPAAAAAAAAAPAPAGTPLAVDTARSSIRALGAKITAEHPIDFPQYAGTATVDGEQLTGLAFTVEMASLQADHPKLTQHLLDEDFFAVARFPQATFRSVAIAPGSDTPGATHTVTGDLMIRGKTKRISFPATVSVGSEAVEARTEFVINRQDFGVTYPGRPDDLVQDNVRMTITLVAPRA